MSKMKRRTNKPRATESANSSTKSSVLDEPTLVERKQQKKQILKFVQRTLEKMPQGLRAEFVGMRRFNDFEKMKAFKEAQEAGKNRYKDVGCLDNNRVKLEGPWPHEYIHANYVATPTNPKRFICTQAPLEKTCADFWYMCYQDKVEYIFMLCNFLEKGAKKCFEYFPSKKGDVMDFDEGGQKISVKCESSVTFIESFHYSFRADAKANVTATEIVIEGPGEKTRKTTHYHWNDWPDRGVPAADMAVLELLENARPSKGPIVVHCSAGIGRTGSVVMLEYIMDQLLAGQIIDDGEKILVKICEQRNNSIQTDAQYLFVHQVILNYFRKKKLMDESGVQEAYDAFLEQYKKVVV